MSVKLTNNPTCVLTDADIYSESQKAKMAKNLMSGLPASSGEGDKVLVLDGNGDPQLKDYSAGGGGTTYYGGDGIAVNGEEISVNQGAGLTIGEHHTLRVSVDGSTIGINASNQLEALGGGGSSAGYTEIEYSTSYETVFNAIETALAANTIPVLVYSLGMTGTFYLPYTGCSKTPDLEYGSNTDVKYYFCEDRVDYLNNCHRRSIEVAKTYGRTGVSYLGTESSVYWSATSEL